MTNKETTFSWDLGEVSLLHTSGVVNKSANDKVWWMWVMHYRNHHHHNSTTCMFSVFMRKYPLTSPHTTILLLIIALRCEKQYILSVHFKQCWFNTESLLKSEMFSKLSFSPEIQNCQRKCVTAITKPKLQCLHC